MGGAAVVELLAILGAAGAFLLAAGHSYLGERYLISRLLRRSDLPPLFGSDTFTRRTLRFAWHITSVAWIGLGVLLFQIPAGATSIVLGRTVALTFLATAIVTAVGSRGRHLAWLLMLFIAGAAWFATRGPW